MAKAIQKITLDPSEDIPFDKLVLSQKNVRHIKAGVSIEDLANDIALRGLLMSVNVRPMLAEGGEETGLYEVPAGGRRYRALELLIKQKRMAKSEPVPCIVKRRGTTSAEDDSLAENVHRVQLHPLDQFRAFKTLSDQGLTNTEIAARYFVSATHVAQRLKLAKLSPKLLDLYENDGIKLDQLEAFTVSDDHARQEQIWETLSRSYNKEGYYIRRLLTETAVRASDRRAVYVGIEAYEAAGGAMMRDLFEQDQGGWIEDPALLEQLVLEKLKVDAEALQAAEGWKWVDTGIDFPYGHTSGLRRFYGSQTAFTEEELACYDAVKADYEKLDAEYAQAEDYSEETEARLDELGTELSQMDDRPYVFDPEEVARGGAFISLSANGEPKVERGFVRPEDEPEDETDDDDGDQHDGDDDDDEAATRSGGGVSVNGQQVAVTSEDEEDDRIRPLADRVIEDLTATRTIAFRNALANDPVMAFIAALHVAVLNTFFPYGAGSDSCLEISFKSATFGQTHGLGDTVWAKEIEQRREGWGKDLPKKASEVWDYLVALDVVSRQALFAHCVSLSVNVVVQPWNKRPGVIAHGEKLARAIGFDMVEAGWAPTVDNYLGRVTKAHILQAVREAKGEQSAQLIEHLRKPDMAREAARLLDGSRWLPEPLRLPVEETSVDAASVEQTGQIIDGEGDESTGDNGDAELPAFLAESAEAELAPDEDGERYEPSHLDAAE